MRKNDRLAEKIKVKLEIWFSDHTDEFIPCMREFCQGNRAALTPLMKMVHDLGSAVFADGGVLNPDLLDRMEYGVFDLIGYFSSEAGSESLDDAIEVGIVDRLSIIFADVKRHWNLQYYKITESVDVLDPDSSLIAEKSISIAFDDSLEEGPQKGQIQKQARDIIDRLVIFAKEKFKGEKNRKIAVNWLENPERAGDIGWLASLAESSVGSTKVTLTRIRQSLARHHELKRDDDGLTLDRLSIPVRRDNRV